MSVRVSERRESKLEAQLKAEKLVAHTVHIVSNPKVFDTKYAGFHDRIVDTAVGIGSDMWEANGIFVGNDPAKYRLRRELQDRAIRQANVLLYLMTIARRLNHLRRGKYEHWVSLATSTRDMARAWRDSDARRYGHLIQEAG